MSCFAYLLAANNAELLMRGPERTNDADYTSSGKVCS